MIKNTNNLITLLVKYQYFLYILLTDISSIDAIFAIDKLLLALLSSKSSWYLCIFKHCFILPIGLLIESKIILFYVLNYYNLFIKFGYSILFILSSSLKIAYFSKAKKVKLSYFQLMKHIPITLIAKTFNIEFIYVKKYGLHQWFFMILILYNLLLFAIALY